MAEYTPPPPRDVQLLEGVDAQDQAFVDAMESGRLHHAWLLTGPEGVGKASFAYRAARRLLGAAPNPAFGILGSSPSDHVSRQISARSHPDLLVLEREGEDGKARKGIPVDDARKLPEFFSKAPGSAPYRVAIIDAADDLNINAANAVLKTLEEPPPKGVLLLVSHSPGRLLATIRSRCRTLAFRALPEDSAAAIVGRQTELNSHEAGRLAKMAQGAPGLALRLAARDALKADDQAHEILRSLQSPDEAALLHIADSFRGADGMAKFELLFDRMADQIRNMAVNQALSGHGVALDRWAQAWEMIVALPVQVEAVNLDRADAFWTAMRELRAATRAA